MLPRISKIAPVIGIASSSGVVIAGHFEGAIVDGIARPQRRGATERIADQVTPAKELTRSVEIIFKHVVDVDWLARTERDHVIDGPATCEWFPGLRRRQAVVHAPHEVVALVEVRAGAFAATAEAIVGLGCVRHIYLSIAAIA